MTRPYVVPLLAPPFLTTTIGARFSETTVRDLRFAMQLLKRNPQWSEAGSLIFPTVAQVAELLDEVRRSGEPLAIDIETVGDHPATAEIRCIGLGYRKRAVVAWLMSEGGVPYWKKPKEERALRELLKAAFSDRRLAKLGQNIILFDVPVIENSVNELGPVVGRVDDMMFAHHVADSELPHGLDYITSRFTECAYYKSMVADPEAKGNEKWASIKNDVLGAYNVKDVLCTARGAVPVLKHLHDWPRAKPLYEEELKIAACLRRMGEAGLRVDQARRRELTSDLQKVEQKHLRILRKIAKQPDLNPNSVLQLRQVMFGRLKFPVLNLRESRTKHGAPSTGKQALFELMIREPHDSPRSLFIRSLAAHRKARKLQGSYLNNLQIFPDGRIHPQWRMLTKSGRFACTPAVNTLPKRIKQIFVSGKGREFCSVDLSQAELRSIAFFAECEMLEEAYETGADVHSFNTVKIFEITPPPEVVKSKKWNQATEKMLDKYQPGWRTFEIDPNFLKTRDLSKRGVFASNYMAQRQTVWRSLRAETDEETGDLLFPDLPISQVEAFMMAWFRAAPEIPQFANERLQEAQEQGYFECPISGRRRYYKDKLDLSDAANQPIQISVASHMNAALLRIEPRIRLLRCTIPLQVHDALTLEGPAGKPIRQAGAIIMEELNKPTRIGNRELFLPCDPPKYGTRLSETV